MRAPTCAQRQAQRHAGRPAVPQATGLGAPRGPCPAPCCPPSSLPPLPASLGKSPGCPRGHTAGRVEAGSPPSGAAAQPGRELARPRACRPAPPEGRPTRGRRAGCATILVLVTPAPSGRKAGWPTKGPWPRASPRWGTAAPVASGLGAGPGAGAPKTQPCWAGRGPQDPSRPAWGLRDGGGGPREGAEASGGVP